MRNVVIAAMLVVSGCGQHRGSAAPAKDVAFDGALVTTAAAERAHGDRLTHVLGCTSCHGARLEGEQFEPKMTQYGPIWASNLTVEVPEYTDVELDGIIRHGTHPERKSVWVMPAEIFQHLSDSDMRALVAYLRSLKPTGIKTPPPQFSALDRAEIASGEYKSEVQLVRETKDQVPLDVGVQHALGRYISEVTCAECHGPRLEGHPGKNGGTPNLIVAAGYSRAEFEKLLTNGVPAGNRKLRAMMSNAAIYRFSYMTPHERDALYTYLKARAEQPQ
jgi:cytochrome c553